MSALSIGQTIVAIASGAAAGGDQVGDGLGLGQVELAGEEGPLAELTGTRLACAQFDAAREQLSHYDRTAVALQFHHVLAGEAARAGEVQRDAVVDHLAACIAEPGVVRVPRLQHRATQVHGDLQ